MTAGYGNCFLACLLAALAAGLVCDLALRRCLKGKAPPMTAFFTAAVTAVFLCLYGFTMLTLHCILLCQVLILAGAIDAVTCEIPDWVPLFIMALGLAEFRPASALSGFLLVPLPFLLAALWTGKLGGGDVKLMAASGFSLGVTRGIWMMVWGLALGLLWNAAFHRGKKSIPLAPFLASGCFLVLLPV